MKVIFVALGAVLFLSACSAPRATSIKDPVGPLAVLKKSFPEGTLVVYTPIDNLNYTEYPLHTSYEIYAKDGVLIKEVGNNLGIHDPNPVKVSLPVGEYKIKSRSKRDGVLTIPVIIEASKTTVLDLNEEMEDQFSIGSSRQLVRTASGKIIGCKAVDSLN